MRKSILIICCAILILLGGCSANETDNNPTKDIVLNPVGTYTDISFVDTNDLFLDFMMQSTGKESQKNTFVITDTDAGYRFQDHLFTGRFTNNGDGDFTAAKETVIATDPLIAKTAKLELEQIPYTRYTVYDNYVVKKVPLSNATINGELPSNGKSTTCFIKIDHLTFSTYTLTFSPDGTCTIMTMFNNNLNSANGTYSANGRIISMTFTKGSFAGKEYTGTVEAALYVEDNMLYDTIYRKS